MKRKWLLGGAAIALCSTLVVAQDAPESLLPPGFDDPRPAPTQTSAPQPAQSSAPATPSAPVQSGATSSPVVQPIPGVPATPVAVPTGLPSISELEELDVDELDELLGLRPRYDIPPAARRSMEQVGVLSSSEGGLATASLARQPGSIVRAAVGGIKQPLVSRWGHIMLRRALASRLNPPLGMNPVEFATLRTRALNNIGEHAIARAIAQEVDTGNWNTDLTDAAIGAFIGTGDIVGVCPATQILDNDNEDARWVLLQNICYAYAGQDVRSRRNFNEALRSELASELDILLARRYAGAAGRARQAVNLEWEGAQRLTPWRFALANALGVEMPEALLEKRSDYFFNVAATTPALGLTRRIEGSAVAGRRGVLSSQAMVDLYSQFAVSGGNDGAAALTASRLREAYVAADPEDRVAAIREIWDGAGGDYSRYVLTAYAAARVTPSADLTEDAAGLIASMLTAGLDADALSWAPFVAEGSEAWALLALAQRTRQNPVTDAQMNGFIGDDESEDARKSQFLLAGMAGLDRIENTTRDELAQSLGVDFGRETNWSRLISRAADTRNQALVAYLAGLGMQGSDWSKMTPRHLYHIVSALNRVGLSAEARMIAAEAVARA